MCSRHASCRPWPAPSPQPPWHSHRFPSPRWGLCICCFYSLECSCPRSLQGWLFFTQTSAHTLGERSSPTTSTAMATSISTLPPHPNATRRVLGLGALSVPGTVCVLTCFSVGLSLLPEKKVYEGRDLPGLSRSPPRLPPCFLPTPTPTPQSQSPFFTVRRIPLDYARSCPSSTQTPPWLPAPPASFLFLETAEELPTSEPCICCSIFLEHSSSHTHSRCLPGSVQKSH